MTMLCLAPQFGAVSVSSLARDDDVEGIEDPPDDIAVLSERGEWGQDFVRRSYLGSGQNGTS
jgi:hypothetical protein